MKKLVIIQTSTPDYRAAFYAELRAKLGSGFELFSGSTYFEPSVKSDPKIESGFLKNIYLLNRKLLFQTGHWHLLFKNKTIVLELNPRIISNWIFLLLRRILGYRTILWGHAWPRKGENSKSDRLRHQMRKLATTIVTYTYQQKKELQKKMPNKTVYAAPNALLSKQVMQVTYDEPKHLIYVGRLSPQKKPLFMVKAFAISVDLIPSGTKLFVIGEGPETEKIKQYIKEKNLDNQVILKGHISDNLKLKELYAKALFSISPGYVGLSITQSFGFGVPMLISRTENHSPEIEAAAINENSVFFKTGDVQDFTERLVEIFENRNFWMEKRPAIVSFCKKQYSVEAMADIFYNLANEYGT